jgi:N-acetylneuraminic acid mutarotase
MGGSSAITRSDSGEPGQPGIYGSKGKAGEKNVPGGRLGAVSWTDHEGHLWLFGGGGFDSSETFGVLNDLWEFDSATREWTWVSGASRIPGFNGGRAGRYGTMGSPDPDNTPGSRTGAVGWTDHEGNLWLFGGAGFDANGTDGNLNDLWEFSPATREWAWMGGSNVLDSHDSAPGNYGAKGSFTAGSYPGSRDFAVAWVGKEGNFWLYGGYGGDSLGNYGQLDDLWEFRRSTGQWAWMGGSTQAQLPAVYGRRGEPSAGNTPGGRDGATGWVDEQGHLWLLGGYGFVSMEPYVVGGFMNDLWEFNPETHEWTWVGGRNTLPSSCATGGSCGWAGVYGTLGKAAADNLPGSRSSAVAWVDQDDNVWIFGGAGYDANGIPSYLNDLWELRRGSGEWSWMGGSTTAVPCIVGDNQPSYCPQPGSYGTLGHPNLDNVPGGRQSAVGWTDESGNRWLMGGDGADEKGKVGDLNDLWEYRSPPAIP